MTAHALVAIPMTRPAAGAIPADRAAEDLVVQMAHDLRSPLSSILVLTESLRSGQAGTVNDAQRRQLGIIYGAALCLCTTASDVVELARGGNRLLESHPAELRISQLLEEVRDMVLPMAVERRIEFRIVPPAFDHRVGSARAISRVLLNLATNALKSTESGYVEIAAREVPGDPEHVEFSVRDTGPGLDPDELQRLHDPSPRASRLRHLFASSGLGLAIVRTLLGAMRSSLRAQSSAKVGTRMYFELHLPRVMRHS
jgi:signal transduction histidine kinase